MWVGYAAEIEASLEATYPHVNIGQWMRGEMSSRKLLVLLNGLPPDCWFWTRVRDDKDRADEAAEIDAAQAARDRQLGGLYARVPADKRKAV